MFTVITKVNPATNTRGARVTVSSEKGKTIYIGGMPGDTPREWHERAIAYHIEQVTERAIAYHIEQVTERRKRGIEDLAANNPIPFMGYESASRMVLTPDHSGYVQFWQEV